MPLREYLFRNGTRVTVGPCWAVTQLPSGATVHAHPDGSEEQAKIARDFGYPDVCALTRDHDALHSWLCAALGLPVSYALAQAAGEPTDARLAGLEEDAVLCLQKFWRATGVPFPARPITPEAT